MRNLFKTVAIVTVFSVCEKFLGFLYRIYMSRTVGAEGVGLYQVALSIFGFIITACCSGTPVTVSRLITKYRAENKKNRINKVITAGLTITILTTLPVCLVFLIFGDSFTFLFADARCYPIFKIVMLGLVFTSIYSIFRGVFWGNKDFLPYSIIELLEEICMIIAGILLISKSNDAFSGAYGAGLAVLISYVFSFSIATIVFFVRKNKLTNPKGELKPLIASSMPVTAMRTVNSLAVSLVSIILPLRLISAGLNESQAMSAFGAAMGQALPILFIPTTLIGSFTLVLIPEVAENYYKKNNLSLKNDIEKAIKFTTFLTCIFIPVFFVCGEEIGIILFGGHECGKYLTASAFLMLFMSLSSISTSMLNSIGLEHKTLVYFIISGILMLLCIWFLPSVIGVYSLLVGFAFVYGLSTILNLKLLNKHCPIKPKYKGYTIFATLLTIPTIIFGVMLENLLISFLGIVWTFMLVSALLIVFQGLLYLSFGIVSFDLIKGKWTSKGGIFRKKQNTKTN